MVVVEGHRGAPTYILSKILQQKQLLFDIIHISLMRVRIGHKSRLHDNSITERSGE